MEVSLRLKIFSRCRKSRYRKSRQLRDDCSSLTILQSKDSWQVTICKHSSKEIIFNTFLIRHTRKIGLPCTKLYFMHKYYLHLHLKLLNVLSIDEDLQITAICLHNMYIFTKVDFSKESWHRKSRAYTKTNKQILSCSRKNLASINRQCSSKSIYSFCLITISLAAFLPFSELKEKKCISKIRKLYKQKIVITRRAHRASKLYTQTQNGPQ